MTFADLPPLAARAQPVILAKPAMEEEETGFSEPEKKLVLIVDDDEEQRDLLKLLVEKEGFRTVMADGGVAALQKAQAAEPDLIVLDLMLPGLGGYEVLRQLQSDGAGGIPVPVISAKVMDARTIEGLKEEANVKDFIAKPPAPSIFANKLHALLKTRKRAAD